MNSGTPVKSHKRCPNSKQSSLPTINKRERNVRSPMGIAEYQRRVVSPIQTRNLNNQEWTVDQNFNNSGITSPTFQYTIEWTEEQSIINEKARIRVQEAKLFRFTGFKSPRVLIRKIFDSQSNWGKYELDTSDSSNEMDVVHTKERFGKSLFFKS